MRPSCVAFILLAVFSSCGGSDREPMSTTATRMRPVPTAPAVGEYDPLTAGALLVVGRDRLRMCVQSLDASTDAGEAIAAMEDALLKAMDDRRWREEFDTPAVDAGCPLGPAVMDPAFQRVLCRPQASPYLLYAFVGESSSFDEVFPDEQLQYSFPVPGIRRASQEAISVGGSQCAFQVAEAWYLTPDDVRDEGLLQQYIFSIFSIAKVAE